MKLGGRDLQVMSKNQHPFIFFVSDISKNGMRIGKDIIQLICGILIREAKKGAKQRYRTLRGTYSKKNILNFKLKLIYRG